MQDESSFDRRTVLQAVGTLAGVGTVGLAGCSSGAGAGTPEPGTVEVGPGGSLVFDPAEIRVAPDETVTWLWDSDLHNIVVESQPTGADWSGTEGGETTLYDAGHEYEHAFQTPGTYAYYCHPHRSAGMTGTVVVTDG